MHGRKIIQISIDLDGDILALCDDGSLWSNWSGEWEQVDVSSFADVDDKR